MLSPEVLTLLTIDTIFLFLGAIAFTLSIKIFFGWNLDSTTQKQYQLEKQSYLTATIIKYILAIKLPLFLFFIFTLDKISNLLTGAMCAAGVVDATEYGSYLLILKLINIYLFGLWLSIHYLDIKNPHLPYTKTKFEFFIIIFLFLALEIIIEVLMFNSIDIDKMVSCCGTLYSSSSNSAIGSIFSINQTLLLSMFYTNFLLIALFYYIKQLYLFAIANFTFIIFSLLSLIQFFGTYIYQLPTHHCPFCFLQSDYYYIGYILYTALFLGTFYGIKAGTLYSLQQTINSEHSMFISFLYV
jgi:hypothetical protein